MKLTTILLAAALALSAGAALAKGSVRPDAIAQLQKEGKVASFEKLNHAALSAHSGGTIDGTRLRHKGDRYVYEVAVVDATGQGWKVRLDAGTTQLLSDKRKKAKQTPAPAVTAPLQ